ncbi:MAG: hypothetical protein E4H40_00910 [Candidatus Brocadiia bacterium]|nr:MAG: hypothetical protein E4H40_00910 [Candidatus Brocadiia bacterium]
MTSSLVLQSYIAAFGGSEDTFWIYILVVVLIAFGLWVYTIIAKKPSRIESEQFPGQGSIQSLKNTFSNPKNEFEKKTAGPAYRFTFTDAERKENHDKSEPGMELLELDFLISVTENTESSDETDVTMRNLSFNEILRRNRQNCIMSNALKVYAVNEHRFYAKNIQCAAMKELAKRTTITA